MVIHDPLGVSTASGPRFSASSYDLCNDVFGMPNEAINLGAAESIVISLNDIAAAILTHITRA